MLSFECQLSVIAIDACSHHGRITDARAERIKKYYAAKMRKSRYGIDLSRVQEAVAVVFFNLRFWEGFQSTSKITFFKVISSAILYATC